MTKEQVPVTQADREAAADIYRRFRYGATAEIQAKIRREIERGQRDDDPIVQVAARQRLAAPQSTPVAIQSGDALREALEYLFDTGNGRKGTPRIIDLCYSAFMKRDEPNPDDGGKSDWFTDTKPLIDKGIAAMRARLAALTQPTTTAADIGSSQGVEASVYEAAVKGRSDFRQAYRALLPVQRAAAALCLLYRSPQKPFQVSDEFAGALDSLDIATCGGGRSGIAKPKLEALAALRSSPATVDDIPEGWVLVPREPTEAMMVAAARELSRQATWLGWEPVSVWSAMIAALPSSPDKIPETGE